MFELLVHEVRRVPIVLVRFAQRLVASTDRETEESWDIFII